MGLCSSMSGTGSHCHGIEYKWGHCELWHKNMGYAQHAKGFFCFHYSPAPVTLRGWHDFMYTAVQPDGSLKRGAQGGRLSVSHKIVNADSSVSFLSHNGKFLSA